MNADQIDRELSAANPWWRDPTGWQGEEEVVSLMLSVASGDMDELQITSWLCENTVPR